MNKDESEQNCVGKSCSPYKYRDAEMGGEQRSSPSYGYKEAEGMRGQQFVKTCSQKLLLPMKSPPPRVPNTS